MPIHRAVRLVALIAALSAGPGWAAALRISPIGLDMPSSERAQAITLVNSDSEPVNLQIRIFKWSQVGGEDQLVPTGEILASPPAATIPPGSSYTVRVARPAAAAVRGELAYRLFIDELPKPVDPRTVSQGVRMVLRTSMPVFVADKAAIAQLAWTVWQDDGGLHAEVINRGSRHAKIASLTLAPAGGTPIVFGEGLNGYVLAGSTKRFDLKESATTKLPTLAPGTPVTLTAKNGLLDIKEALSVAAR